MAKHPVPKKRTSSSRRDKRRSHHALKEPTLIDCPNCNYKMRPHTVCQNCGYYKGVKVIAAKDD